MERAGERNPDGVGRVDQEGWSRSGKRRATCFVCRACNRVESMTPSFNHFAVRKAFELRSDFGEMPVSGNEKATASAVWLPRPVRACRMEDSLF